MHGKLNRHSSFEVLCTVVAPLVVAGETFEVGERYFIDDDVVEQHLGALRVEGLHSAHADNPRGPVRLAKLLELQGALAPLPVVFAVAEVPLAAPVAAEEDLASLVGSDDETPPDGRFLEKKPTKASKKN